MSSNFRAKSSVQGVVSGQGRRVGIVCGRFNDLITNRLLDGATNALGVHGVAEDDVTVVWVPGAFEIPFGIRSYWDAHKYKDDRPTAFIALGCVIRGDTPHFEYVCRAVTDGVLQLNMTLPVPTIFGVLTVDNQQQADERIGGKHGHKGEEAAITALKMIAVKKSFQ